MSDTAEDIKRKDREWGREHVSLPTLDRSMDWGTYMFGNSFIQENSINIDIKMILFQR